MTAEPQGTDAGMPGVPVGGDAGPLVPADYEEERCYECRSVVFWAALLDEWGNPQINPRTGIRLKACLDATVNADGSYRIVGDGQARRITAGELVPIAERFDSHFKTCSARRDRPGLTKRRGRR